MQTVKAKAGLILCLADLYRRHMPELPERFAAHWRSALTAAFHDAAELFFTDVACTAEELAAGVAQCEKNGCDVLIVAPMAYIPSGVVIGALRSTSLPLVIVSSARDAALPYDMGGDHLLANQGMHGVYDLTNALWRAGRQCHIVSGHPAHPAFQKDLQKIARLARAVRVLRKGRAGRIGEPFDGMLDFAYAPANQSAALGFEVVPIEPAELVAGAKNMADKRCAEYEDWARNTLTLDADLVADELRHGVAFSLAMSDMVKAKGLDSIAMNFMPVVATGASSLPFLGASRLMAEGIGYAGEGDVLTATLVAALMHLENTATFTELFCPDYTRGEILLSHMGECNLKAANRTRAVRLAARPFAWGQCRRIPVAVFQMQSGPVTLVSISETPGRHSFRLLAFTADMLEAPDHLNLKNPHGRLRTRSDLRQFVEEYSRVGGTHHLALVYGDVMEEIKSLAGLAGLPFSALVLTSG